MAIRTLIDTCVWLDLAKDYRDQPVLAALEDLVRSGEVLLVIPQNVLEEFDRNKARVVEETRRGLQSHFRLVREAVSCFAEGADREAALTALSETDHKIVVSGDAVFGAILKIEGLLRGSPAVSLSEEIKGRITERALLGAAPYHRDKNSVGDAILIETYRDVVAAVRAEDQGACAFVTHNYRDFSHALADRRSPHPDLADLFESGRSTYWVSLVDFIKHIDPDLLADHDFEFNHAQQPRRLSEILEGEHLLFQQVWYNRHWNLRNRIEGGQVRVVGEGELSRTPHRADEVLDTVWARALQAAKRTEDEVGLENLGPWDDFEWGMLNGKLSALRWALGDEWDFLDT